MGLSVEESNRKKALAVKLYDEGLSIQQIMQSLHMTGRTIQQHFIKLGIPTDKYTRKYNFNEDYFEVIDSEEKAYWFGFMYADGSVNENHKKGKLKGMVLELAIQDQDKEHLTKFLRCINALDVPVKFKIVTLNKKHFVNYRITVCSTKMCNDLIKLGCTPRKSLTKDFPSFLKPKYLRHFLRGYFDGNGHISSDRCNVAFSTGSIKMAEGIQNYFHHKGSKGNIKSKAGSKGLDLIYSNKFAELMILTHLYSDANIYLDRKYDVVIARLLRNQQNDGSKYGEALQ